MGKDCIGSARYFASPDRGLVNIDFKNLSDHIRQNDTVRKQIFWESEDCSEVKLAQKGVELTREKESNYPEIGYSRWPKWLGIINRLIPWCADVKLSFR